MNYLIIICEGPTEQSFCNDILKPLFQQKEIYLSAPLIKKSNGGIVKWETLRSQIENHLNENGKTIVTTFIDYYGLTSKHKFPSWEEAEKVGDKNVRIDMLESGMKNSIHEAVRFRFIPFIQLHEYESLLFSNVFAFDNLISPRDFINKEQFHEIALQNPNPETINNSKATAPSARLQKHINGYNKVLYGSLLAEEIGLRTIRDKNPRFNRWIVKLEEL